MATEMTEQTGEGPRGGPLGWWHRTGEFFDEVRGEMKRVTRREAELAGDETLTSIFFGLYLFGVDMLFSTAVQWVLRRFGAGAA